MKRILFIVVAGTVLAAVTICFAIQHSTRAALEARRESKLRQGEELTLATVEHERLSCLVSQISNPRSLSNQELAELLRLRSEVGQLRGSTGQKTQLQASNERLRAAVARCDEELDKARANPNFWPKEQLSFAGYATPEAAVKSMLWIMCNGDITGWRSVCTPEAWSNLEEGWIRRGASEAKRDLEIKSMASDLVSPSFGFHVVEQKLTAPDQATVAVSFDGEGKIRTFVLRKVENSWRFHDLSFDP